MKNNSSYFRKTNTMANRIRPDLIPKQYHNTAPMMLHFLHFNYITGKSTLRIVPDGLTIAEDYEKRMNIKSFYRKAAPKSKKQKASRLKAMRSRFSSMFKS